MAAPSGLVLCGTPRTGSTLLCGLLTSTGVLGRPESYFREPDEETWARRLGVPAVDGRVVDYPRFVRAVRAAATTHNGVLAVRVMWGSLDRIVDGLGGSSERSDLAVLEAALGPLAFVHLRRQDVVAQAVSWARAEQTGHWQQGDATRRAPRLDLELVTGLVRTVAQHDAAWRSWFTEQGIRPTTITYEDLVRDRRSAVASVAALLGIALPDSWQPVTHHRRQADRLNHEWAAALRAFLDARGESIPDVAVDEGSTDTVG